MSDPGGSGLDAIARDLASGAISRRAALRRFGGIAVGAMLPSALFADSALARCPKERRCDGRCCPKHAHCKRGKCKCNRGFTKCGKKCRNLQTDERNCGSCGHACADGETCVSGQCTPPTACSSAGDCPDPGTCLVATCEAGVCGSAADPTIGGPCQCSCGPGHEAVAGVVVCSPETGNTCQCDPCPVSCSVDTDCPDQTADCKTATCVSGTCQYTLASQIGQPCDDGNKGICRSTGTFVCNGNHLVECNITSPGQAPRAEICGNGLDDDCDGVVDNGCPCSSNSDCPTNLCSGGVCVACANNVDCGGTSDPCSAIYCNNGVCDTHVTEGDVCGSDTSDCRALSARRLCCSSGTCSQICSTCISILPP